MFDPPAGIGREFVAEPEIEFFEGAQESEVALLNQVVEGQPAIAVFLSDADDEPEIRFNHLLTKGLKILVNVQQFADVDGELLESHEKAVLEHLEPLPVDGAGGEFDAAVEIDAGLEHFNPVDDDLVIFAELVTGDVEFGKDIAQCFPACRAVAASGFECGSEFRVPVFEFFAPGGELRKKFAGREFFFFQRRGLEEVGGIGIGTQTVVQEPEMFEGDESERMEIGPHLPGDGVDLVSQFLLLFGGEGREFSDLPEIAGKGIREIIGSHGFGSRMVDRFLRTLSVFNRAHFLLVQK